MPKVDPGYGSARGPKGSEEWAKRWRLEFQNVVQQLPGEPKINLEMFELGKQYRAWTLVTDKDGKHFKDFDSFCAYRQPYGLGIEPARFKTYLEAEIGKKALELETVDPSRQGERTDLKGTSRTKLRKSNSETIRRLRAILRAPELIQDLYRRELVSQTIAAMMGPQNPDEDKAARVVRAWHAVAAIPRPADDKPRAKRNYRKRVDETIRRAMGKPKATPLEAAQKAAERLDAKDRARLLAWLQAGARKRG
jgi:hypothetical protein